MKSSFYFVLWIVIYPLLSLIGNRFVNDNEFIIALVVVWFLSKTINRSIPEIIHYQRICEASSILGDIYDNNIAAFEKRLTRYAMIQSVSALYFLLTTVIMILTVAYGGVNSWIALAVFGLLAVSSLSLCMKTYRNIRRINNNPSTEECKIAAQEIFHLNYQPYLSLREKFTNSGIPQNPPSGYTLYRVISILFALASIILGIIFGVRGAIVLFHHSSFEGNTFGAIMFLYGSMAVYFGIKDFYSLLRKPRFS